MSATAHAPFVRKLKLFTPYRIEGFLGAGGMGEVYRATDTRLGRQVVIKVSAARFSERFEREARAIASLNHPHICQLYDVGPNYLVMELVGPSTVSILQGVADVFLRINRSVSGIGTGKKQEGASSALPWMDLTPSVACTDTDLIRP
jgi:serine/threonine protein kinase